MFRQLKRSSQTNVRIDLNRPSKTSMFKLQILINRLDIYEERKTKSIFILFLMIFNDIPH